MDISLGFFASREHWYAIMRSQCIYMYMDDLVLLHSWILYIDVNTSFHNYAIPDHGICLAGSIY